MNSQAKLLVLLTTTWCQRFYVMELDWEDFTCDLGVPSLELIYQVEENFR